MTAQERYDCLAAAAHWRYLADTAEAMADWDRQHGLDLSAPGQSAGDYRAEAYRRCARTLQLEAETGVPHCMCHEKPVPECPTRKQKGA